jgi:hypothetical protein
MSTSKTTRSKTGDVSGNNAVSIMDKLIEIEAKMESKLDSLAEKFDQKLNTLRMELKADIKNELRPQILKNERDIETNKKDICQTRENVQDIEHTLERMWKSCDLIVRGVPVIPGENVLCLYETIAGILGYDKSTTPRAHMRRLGKKQLNSRYEPPILISFTNRFEKADFYRRYFNNVRKLTLAALGFVSTSRFYLSENLTKRDQKIFTAALKLKKAKKLHSVSTSAGVIWVRQKSDEDATTINSLSGLAGYESDNDGD